MHIQFDLPYFSISSSIHHKSEKTRLSKSTDLSTDASPDYKTYLTLRTTRTPTFQSAAEIDSVKTNYQHLSLRLLARVVGSPGACAGIFTWYCPGLCRATSSPDVEEADIEILTSSPKPNNIHFTNQPSESPLGYTFTNATTNPEIPNGRLWTEWNEYRYDWTPGMSTWYVNDEKVANISFHAPERPSQLILNMWSNGGSWTGNMSVGDAAFLQIQWIEIAFNTSDVTTKRDESGSGNKRGLWETLRSDSENGRGLESRADGKHGGCKVMCSIDSGTVVGTPVVVKSRASGQGVELSFPFAAFFVLLYTMYLY